MKWIGAVVVLAAIFLGGWWLGNRFARPEVVETVRVQPVFYERPEPINSSDITVSVNVPRFIFARDTVMLQANPGNVASNVASFTNQVTNHVTNQVGDSVAIPVSVRTLEYRDSTYYARVVGPVVGDLAPRLDFIETYNTTITRTVMVRPRFMLAAGAGTEYSRAGWTPYAELAFSVDLKFATVSATVGADDVLRNPIPRVGLSASVPLWSR